MKYRLAIFDLDGTILDTLDDLTASVNFALKTCGFPVRTRQEVRQFLGNGATELVRRSLPEAAGEAQREQVIQAFHKHYGVHCNDRTRPYPEICQLIRELCERNILTAVLSNKPDYGVQSLISLHFPEMFDMVLGVTDKVKRKPAPDGVLGILKTLQCTKSQTIYIGDSEVDIETAANAGVDCLAVSWGFRSLKQLEEAGAAQIVNTPEELKQILFPS